MTTDVLLLDAQDVAAAAPPLPDIIELIEHTYRQDAQGTVQIPTKVGLHPHGPGSFLHAMPAWVADSQALGMKWVSFFPGNTRQGLPDSSALIVLNDPENGLPVAIMEGMWITYARTSACAAVAARYCSNPTPRTLGLVGCGGLGRWSLRMLSALFPSIERVHVSSARAQSRQAFCAEMAAEGPWEMIPVDSVREAMQGMDIVVSSVPKLRVPPMDAAWWDPGTLVIPLDVTGAWDDAMYAQADRLVCDHRDNLRQAMGRYRPGLTLDENRMTDLQALVTGAAGGRSSPQDRILAFVTGIGSIDMTVARDILRRAQDQGLGKPFRFI